MTTQASLCPVFISLVGASSRTKSIFDELTRAIPRKFPTLSFLAVPDPFKDYGSMKIGDKRKRDYVPEARVCFRWGLFYQQNAELAEQFGNFDIVLTPRFGYDLYRGAVADGTCSTALKMHQTLVPFGVTDLNLCPPLYLFTDPVSPEEAVHRKAYFAHPGQRFLDIDQSTLFEPGEVGSILDVIERELTGAPAVAQSA